MAFDSYGAPSFGLSDVKVAAWNATNSYGTAVDVMSAQQLGGTLRVSAAELTGDDAITATGSRPIGGEIRLRFGGVSIAALEVILGLTATSSVASPNAVKQLKVAGGERLPYFGLVGKALAEEGSGDLTIFYPKCKIMSDIQLVNMEYGNFAIPELTIMAVKDDTYGVLSLIEHQASTSIAIPPANIV